MSRFSIRNPYFIVVICLAISIIGVVNVARMPVDLFPAINIPEVVVATFYSGMPPVDIETDITNPLERFFTLAAGMDHMESRSMLGVSIIRAVLANHQSLPARRTRRRGRKHAKSPRFRQTPENRWQQSPASPAPLR